MSENYIDILARKTFSNTIISGKDGLRLRRLLSNEDANTVLDIVWKESSYVSKDNIVEAGCDGKEFHSEITCYSLGMSLANDKNNVASTVARVRSIILAGCEYGLISRNRISSKSAPVRCESLLNDMMIELAKHNIDSAKRFSVQIGWEFSSTHQQSISSGNWRA